MAAIASAATLAVVVAQPRLSPAGAAAPAPTGPPPPTVIGINVGNPSYWSSEWAFDDIIQSTASFKFINAVGQWSNLTDQIPRDAQGHPIGVPAGTRLAVMVQSGSPRLPTGTFACRISPGWTVRAPGDWQLAGSGTSFRVTVPQPVPRNGMILLLTAAKAGADLTELSCRPVGAPPARVFNPVFLADVAPYRVLRFMDWMRTNGAPLRRWGERPTPAAFSQAGDQGVAIEHIVALANAAHADPWINLPFDAEPDYYRRLALYVRDHLAPDRHVYVELSNEVWNTGFGQAKAAAERGRQRYPASDPTQASDFYYADRVREAMAVWTEVFGAQQARVVRVLASQAVNPRRAEQALSHNDTWRSVDALATAPYFGTAGADIQAPPGPARVDAIFAQGPRLVDEAIGYARAAKAVARAHGLRYIAYEGGPAFNSYRPDLQPDLLAVNKDPRIHDLYALFLKRWRAEIGDLFMAYDAVSTPSVGGSWGARTYTGQPLAEAPKARALVEAAAP